MPKLVKRCSECNSLWETEKKIDFFPGTIILTNKHCSHEIFTEDLKLEDNKSSEILFADGTKLFRHQTENLAHFMNAGLKAGCFDEVGLGKTLSALAIFRLYDTNPEVFGTREVYPAAILVRSGLKLQWMREIFNRLGKIPQIIDAKTEPNFDLFAIHIYSMDYLKNLDANEILPYKTVIVDECHLIKNPNSARTEAVRNLVRGSIVSHVDDCPGDDCDCPPDLLDTSDKNVIVLSGTPIKNNAGEYFTVCNLIRPDIFPVYTEFLEAWTYSSNNGRGYSVGGLRDPKRFKEYTKDFFIRHTQEEELPYLPKVRRDFQIRILESEFEKKYKKELEEFKDYYNDSGSDDSFTRSSNLLSYMNRMRHIVGLAKVKDAIEFISEFLMGNERKLVVFHHHADVGRVISEGCKELCKILGLEEPLLISECSPEVRDKRIQEFVNNPKARILVAGTIKSGEGLNLQVCSDCLIVERQWNPANEEQAEGRFKRIGSTAEHINSTYLISANSIDELFTEIVEKKRKIIQEANQGEELPDDWDEKSVMKELSEVLMANNLKSYNVIKKFEAQKEKAIS